MFENKQFAAGTNAVAQAVADATQKSGAKSIIGGGDSVKALNKAKLGDKVTFMSTGGGASLEFLEGAVLPGVAALVGQITTITISPSSSESRFSRAMTITRTIKL